MDAQGKILVIRGGALGDFVLTLPVLAALRRQFPRTQLQVLGYPHIASLARSSGLAHEVRSIEAPKLAGFFARGGNLCPDLAAYFQSFDVIVSYLYDPDQIFQDNVAACSEAQFLAGPHRPDESLQIPAACCLLQPLERLAIFDADPVPRLHLPVPAPLSTGRRLALHPGSGSELKNWPEARWGELLRKLASEESPTPWHFLLVGGEAEGERLNRLQELLPAERTKLARHLPLPDLAELLVREARFFIGHDSGISHLAAALDLPGLVLWGPSEEKIWRPPSDKVRILRHPRGLDSLSVEQVWEALTELPEPDGHSP